MFLDFSIHNKNIKVFPLGGKTKWFNLWDEINKKNRVQQRFYFLFITENSE